MLDKWRFAAELAAFLEILDIEQGLKPRPFGEDWDSIARRHEVALSMLRAHLKDVRQGQHSYATGDDVETVLKVGDVLGQAAIKIRVWDGENNAAAIAAIRRLRECHAALILPPIDYSRFDLIVMGSDRVAGIGCRADYPRGNQSENKSVTPEYLGNGKLRIDGETIQLGVEEDGTVRAMIAENGIASFAALPDGAPRVLKRLRKKYPALGIQLPGAKGKGGYRMGISDARPK